MGVMGVDVLANRGVELRDAAVDAAPQLLGRQVREPAFDQVEPGSVGRREVDVHARPLGQPLPDPSRLVGAVVIHDEVQIEVRWHGGVDRVEELPELDGAVPLMKLRDHQIERRTHDYRRHGTPTLFAALNTKTHEARGLLLYTPTATLQDH
jgi:hypothetical protein